MDLFAKAVAKAQSTIDKTLGIDEGQANEAMEASMEEGAMFTQVAGKVVEKIKVNPTSFSTGYYKRDRKIPKPDDFFSNIGGDFASPEAVSKSEMSNHSSPDAKSRGFQRGTNLNNDFSDEGWGLNDSIGASPSKGSVKGNAAVNDSEPSAAQHKVFDQSPSRYHPLEQGSKAMDENHSPLNEGVPAAPNTVQAESEEEVKEQENGEAEASRADDFLDFPDPPAFWDEAETPADALVTGSEEGSKYETSAAPVSEAHVTPAESSSQPYQEDLKGAEQDDSKHDGVLEGPDKNLTSSTVESSAESNQEDGSQLGAEGEKEADLNSNSNEEAQTVSVDHSSPVSAEREAPMDSTGSANDTTDQEAVEPDEIEESKTLSGSPASQAQRGAGCAVCRGNEEALKEALRRNQGITQERDSLLAEMSQVKTELKQLQDALARKGTQYQEEIEKQEALEVTVQEKEGFIQQLRKELNTLRDSKADSSTVSQQLKDSESAREQLMDEGRRLMTEKQSLEKIIKGLRKQLKDREKDEERYKEGKAAEEARKKAYEERLAALGEQAQNSKMQTDKLMAECSDLRKKLQGKEKEIGQHVKKIAELERTVKDTLKCNEDLARKLEDVASDAQTDARRAVEKEKKAYEKEAEEKIEMLSDSLESMQAAMRRLEAQSNSKEQRLRAELEDVQQRCREAEERVLELSSSVPDATRPLLRQIESLQTSFVDKQRIWEQLEKTLRQRWYLHLLLTSEVTRAFSSDAEAEARQAVEREKVAADRLKNEQESVASLEIRVSSLQGEASRLSAELRSLREELEIARKAEQDATAEVEVFKSTSERRANEISELKASADLMLHREKVTELELKATQDREKAAEEKAMLQRQIRSLETSVQTIKDVNYDRSRGGSRTEADLGGGYSNFSQDSVFDVAKFSSAHSLQDRNGWDRAGLKFVEPDFPRADGSKHLEKHILMLQQQKHAKEAELLPILQNEVTFLRQRQELALELLGAREEELDDLRLTVEETRLIYRAELERLMEVLPTSDRWRIPTFPTSSTAAEAKKDDDMDPLELPDPPAGGGGTERKGLTRVT
ncbi:hypothetical protein GUITHDRAFT_110240 [Guillardia theta CCMP2712]|uniref:TATA element modulatory factor 1 TATA binding domain-containing protein n=1 Tax=Guillardia theta (strain CCMP2712) TaxID=905079 RepID=L1J6U7_GUITC|nr:hypothetical protein GUITHDRAFT_110240 [Guillardia theta CCMP2712]EKX43785.1 hypothetical protein GUITHDRAFT_110240 [Guillardia theta CCMP2712]|eukprot:XP_005830765.1 hypothetical protein GUITHDRAFT_110240 [Guillardia theta CCMP2712]